MEDDLDGLVPDVKNLIATDFLDPCSRTMFALTCKRYYLYVDKNMFGHNLLLEALKRCYKAVARFAFYELRCPWSSSLVEHFSSSGSFVLIEEIHRETVVENDKYFYYWART